MYDYSLHYINDVCDYGKMNDRLEGHLRLYTFLSRCFKLRKEVLILQSNPIHSSINPLIKKISRSFPQLSLHQPQLSDPSEHVKRLLPSSYHSHNNHPFFIAFLHFVFIQPLPLRHRLTDSS